MDEKLEERLQERGYQAAEYSVAEAERSYLENYRHSKLALLMKDAEVAGIKTCAAQEREARAHPEYLELLLNLKTATEIAERNQWHLRIAMQISNIFGIIIVRF